MKVDVFYTIGTCVEVPDEAFKNGDFTTINELAFNNIAKNGVNNYFLEENITKVREYKGE